MRSTGYGNNGLERTVPSERIYRSGIRQYSAYVSAQNGDVVANGTCPVEESQKETDSSADVHLSNEEEVFLYQPVNDDSEFALLVQRLTYMGCSMESLRSSLAKWVHGNPLCTESVWSPSLRQQGSSELEMFSWETSESFAECMKCDDWEKVLKESCVQMRLL